MKNSKRNIINAGLFLAVLISTQTATAFYCPSTGRWSSRDPIGEPGFETLRIAAQIAARPTPLPAPRRWINRVPAKNQRIEPSGFTLATQNDLNEYAFVQNAPPTYIDLLGLIPGFIVQQSCDGNRARINNAYMAAFRAIDNMNENDKVPPNLQNTVDCLMAWKGQVTVNCPGKCSLRCWLLKGKTAAAQGFHGIGDDIYLCGAAFSGNGYSLGTTIAVETAKAHCGLTSAGHEYEFADWIQNLTP